MNDLDQSVVLEEALSERDKQLKEKILPEINIGEAVPISGDLPVGLQTMSYGVRSVVGSTADGIIGNRTNSLVTIDSEIEWKQAPVAMWAKSVTWTKQELEVAARLNIAVDTFKQDDLYQNAMATIQRVGYVGHPEVRGQLGLLNSEAVEVTTNAKTLDEMDAEEVVSMILTAYDKAWAKSDYRIQPTHIAIDATDYMKIMQKFSNTSVIVGTDLLPISAMDRVLAALRKASGNESFSINFVKVNSGFARNIKKGHNRLAIYTYDSAYLEMRVSMPELLPVLQKDLLTYDCGYRAAFTGVMWREPESAVYLDYKA